MIVYPNAKINLGLHVVEKRGDGFHNLETVFYPIPLCDILEIVPNNLQKVQFFSSGIEIPQGNSKNLVEKAFNLLKADFDIPFVDIHLHKVIPIGAGLGGGSSDASFALKTLNELFQLKLSKETLENYASQLGSDCPFFVGNKAVYATGKGDVFSPFEFSLSGKYLLLIYPNMHVSTADAYGGISPKLAENDIRNVLNTDITEWKEKLTNDFELTVFKKHPALKKLKEELYEMGAEYSCMSGSGSSMIGIFSDEIKFSKREDLQHWVLKLS